MNSYFIQFLLFFLPLIVFPFGISPFEIPKVILVEAVIDMLLIVTIWNTKNFSFKNVSYIQLLIYGSIGVLSVIHLFFFTTSTTFFGNIFRLQGVFLLWHLLLFSLLSSQIDMQKRSLILPVLSYFLLFWEQFFSELMRQDDL